MRIALVPALAGAILGAAWLLWPRPAPPNPAPLATAQLALPALKEPTLEPPAAKLPALPATAADRVRALETAPVTPENTRHLNEQLVVWFATAPREATRWLNASPRRGEMSEAIASIAATLAERGQLDLALDWLSTATEPHAQHRAMIEIYNLQARLGRVTREGLERGGFTPDEIELIFRGD